MKIACISDTHGIWLPQIPDDVDMVLHAGDLGPDRRCSEWLDGPFADWAMQLDVPVYCTWGNHDFIGQRLPKKEIDQLLPLNVVVLVDEQITFGEVKIWFSPWSNLFGDWAFMDIESELRKKYANIPDDTHIIVSHGPPKGYGDRTDGRYGPPANVGSQALLDRFVALPSAVALVCGHIHCGAGVYPLPLSQKERGVRSVINCSQVNEEYQPVYGAVRMIEL